MCIKFSWIWNVIIFSFLKLVFSLLFWNKLVSSDQVPKTIFLSPTILNFLLGDVSRKGHKEKKKSIYMSLWKFRFLEDQGQHSIDPSTFKLSEYDMICNIEVKAHQSGWFKNVTCLLYLTFRWAHEFLPAVSTLYHFRQMEE